MFKNNKKLSIYAIIVFALSMGIFSITDAIWIFYVMAILIFLGMLVLGNLTKRDKVKNFIGVVVFMFVLFVGSNFLR